MRRSARGRRAYHCGHLAENVAARAYEARGATILARNWRCREGELDLIAEQADELVFIEVKSGVSARGRDVISPRQWSRLEAAAMRYIVETGKGETPMRFDAVFIGPDGAAEVIENAHMSERW